jgi:mannosyltransferase
MITHIPSHKTPLLLLLVILLALVLRLYQIDRESFWIDEATSYWVASSSPVSIVQTSTKDVHPPLYYLTLHYWMKIFGNSDGVIRLLSATFGILAIPVVFHIGKLLFNERFGLVASLFLAVSGFHIQYSQEARSYSLYFLLTSLSVLFIILALKRIRYSWIVYILSTVLLLYTHNTAVLVVPAIMLLYLIFSWPWRLKNIYPFLFATFAVVIFYIPWIPVYISQVTQVEENFWTSNIKLSHIREAVKELVLIPSGANTLSKIQYSLLCLPFSILLLSLPVLYAKEKKRLIALTLLFLIPVGANLIFSIMIRNIFILRVLIPSLLPLTLLWATPILIEREPLLSPYRNLALVAMASMLLISTAGSIDFLLNNSKEPWRRAAEIFQKGYKAGDRVVYLSGTSKNALVRYLPQELHDLPAIAVRPAWFDLQRLSEDSHRALQDLRAKNIRLWLVWRHSPSRDKGLTNVTIAWLDTNCKKTLEWKQKNLEVILYEPQWPDEWPMQQQSTSGKGPSRNL